MEWNHRQLLWLNRRRQLCLGCHGDGAAFRFFRTYVARSVRGYVKSRWVGLSAHGQPEVGR